MDDSITLAALAAHPDAGQIRALVASDARWNRVQVAATEAELPVGSGADLAVLTATAPSTSWQTEALMRRVRDAGYTGLALPCPHELPASTLAVGARIGIALVDTAEPTAFAKVCWELLEAGEALVLTYVRKVVRSIEYTASDIGDLLRHLASGLGQSVAIVDAAAVLHYAREQPSDELLAGIDFNARWVHRVSAGGVDGVSVEVQSPVRSGLRLIISGAGLTAAQLRALSGAVEVAMPAVAARLLFDEVRAVGDASRSSVLLSEFLDRKGYPDAALERRIAECGWRTAGWHLAFKIVGRSRLDALEIARVLAERLARLPADSHVVVLGEGAAGWLSFPNRPTAQALEGWVLRLREIHDGLSDDLSIATGVGSFASEGAGLAASLSEAADAARMAVNRASTGWFVHFDRLGLTQLLGAWTASDTFEPAARSLLEQLASDDLRTLAAYLDHESSLIATAHALGVHRNTVGPRMRRIQRLLAVDLDDPEVRLALHLACRVVLASDG